jgi:hypothetical protein
MPEKSLMRIPLTILNNRVMCHDSINQKKYTDVDEGTYIREKATREWYLCGEPE